VESENKLRDPLGVWQFSIRPGDSLCVNLDLDSAAVLTSLGDIGDVPGACVAVDHEQITCFDGLDRLYERRGCAGVDASSRPHQSSPEIVSG
jgi:hypothetical protein